MEATAWRVAPTQDAHMFFNGVRVADAVAELHDACDARGDKDTDGAEG